FSLQQNVLIFKWTSAATGNVCRISFLASDDYPDNSLITQFWESSGRENSTVCCMTVNNLLHKIGEDLLVAEREEKMDADSESKTTPYLGGGDTHTGDRSDSEYSDCQSHMSEDDYDQSDYYGDLDTFTAMSEGYGKTGMDKVHPLLQADMQTLRDVYSESSLSYRLLDSIGEIDVELKIPLNFLNLTTQMAKAWKLNIEEPLIIRIHLASMSYLDSPGQLARNALIMTRGHLQEASILLSSDTTSSEDAMVYMDDQNSPAGDNDQTNSATGSYPRQKHRPIEVKTPAHIRHQTGGHVQKEKQYMSKILLQQTNSRQWYRSKQTTVTSTQEPSLSQPDVARQQDMLMTQPVLTNVKESPSLENGFLVMMFRYARQRIPTLNEFCVVCDEPHVFQNGAMLMPAVCSRELCVFAYQTLGVMVDAAADIATGAEVVDLLIAMTRAAVISHRRSVIFEPFPNIVDPHNPKELAFSEKNKDYKKLGTVINQLPPMRAMTSVTCGELHAKLDTTDRLLFPLLTWIISSNRSHIVKLPPERQIMFMVTPHQFLLLSSPPAKEAAFQTAKKIYGSTFAFHFVSRGLVLALSAGVWYQLCQPGSGTSFVSRGLVLALSAGVWYQLCQPGSGASFVSRGLVLALSAGVCGSSIENWHSIIRMGLIVASGTKRQVNGAAYGHGIYLSPLASMSFNYSCMGYSRHHVGKNTKPKDKQARFLSSHNLNCIALCEVICSPVLKKHRDIWVCPDPDHVCTRSSLC
ncbi:hypothetical protein BaRGS_00035176, partial [Batillaria attramentaria]